MSVYMPVSRAIQAKKKCIPPGKLSHSELENHHAISGKTHYFYDHFLCRFLYVYQGRVPSPQTTTNNENHLQGPVAACLATTSGTNQHHAVTHLRAV